MRGVAVDKAVEIIAVTPMGPDSVLVVYQAPGERPDHRVLLRSDEPGLVEEAAYAVAFDADPAEFKLAAEALRIQCAAQSADGVLVRRVKEDLLTLDGRPLFPKRAAYTVDYELSSPETALYEAVTDYVRQEWNRVDQLRSVGEGRRGNTVGFALTVLQRRLASSPEAILRSLERRQHRLETRLKETLGRVPASSALDNLIGDSDPDDLLDEFDAEEREMVEEAVMTVEIGWGTVSGVARERC